MVRRNENPSIIVCRKTLVESKWGESSKDSEVGVVLKLGYVSHIYLEGRQPKQLYGLRIV